MGNKMVTPVERVKLISDRISKDKATKRPIQIIDTPAYDPTIRKKPREEHPLNRILHRRLNALKESKTAEIKTPPMVLSDTDSEPETTTEANPGKPPISPPIEIIKTDLDLSVSSDSDSSNDEDVCKNLNIDKNKPTSSDQSSLSSECSSINNDSIDSTVKPSTSTANMSNNNAVRAVNFNLKANEIHEYVPEPLVKPRNNQSIYNPTPIPRVPRPPEEGHPL